MQAHRHADTVPRRSANGPRGARAEKRRKSSWLAAEDQVEGKKGGAQRRPVHISVHVRVNRKRYSVEPRLELEDVEGNRSSVRYEWVRLGLSLCESTSMDSEGDARIWTRRRRAGKRKLDCMRCEQRVELRAVTTRRGGVGWWYTGDTERVRNSVRRVGESIE
ncbi:hypothetical protein BV20DRAFT_670168 [Pilatotrama ljubarskyi]|nr:hypothetical protein BV20DRAFT_670168 [Pilatotrama ljubarskyi]